MYAGQARECTHIMFIALEDVAEVSSLLSVDEGKDLLVLRVKGAK